MHPAGRRSGRKSGRREKGVITSSETGGTGIEGGAVGVVQEKAKPQAGTAGSLEGMRTVLSGRLSRCTPLFSPS